jgi:hypothetical protein
MPLWRYAKTRPNMRAHEIQTAAIASTGKNIEPRFEPIVEAVSDFDLFVSRLINRKIYIISLTVSFKGKVVV